MTSFTCKKFEALSLEECYAMMVLRQEVFVVEQDCPYLDADGKDQKGWHLLGYDDASMLIAYSRLLPAGVSYATYPSIGRIATAAKVRRTGVGRELMRTSLEWCERLFGKRAVKISAQCYLEKFYTSFGFERVGASYLEDGIPHIAMINRTFYK